ncbi:MAG: PIN domain nuclease [Acidimicrobiia bacterium]
MTLYLVDTSAWHRSAHPDVARRWQQLLMEDRIALCHQVMLEILYSARSADDYAALRRELAGVRLLPNGIARYERALDVQQALSEVGGLHHRSVQISDLLIAASAESAGAVVWHYDEDFDRIASITGQAVEWVAPRGSL